MPAGVVDLRVASLDQDRIAVVQRDVGFGEGQGLIHLRPQWNANVALRRIGRIVLAAANDEFVLRFEPWRAAGLREGLEQVVMARLQLERDRPNRASFRRARRP